MTNENKWKRQPHVLNDGTETLRYVNEHGDWIIKWPTLLSRGIGKPRGRWLHYPADGTRGHTYTSLTEAKHGVSE